MEKKGVIMYNRVFLNIWYYSISLTNEDVVDGPLRSFLNPIGI